MSPRDRTIVARADDARQPGPWSGSALRARAGDVGRDVMAQTEGRLFSPDSRMTLEVADPGVDRAQTLSLSFGGGTNVAERVAD